jgi:FtsP/CotA-like multicopper oxidase with cupredoxin domain
MKGSVLLPLLTLVLAGSAFGQSRRPSCARPAAGSVAEEPRELRSENGALRVKLEFRSYTDAAGQVEYCYIDEHGDQAPTLRVHPGDEVTIELSNDAHASAHTMLLGHVEKMMTNSCTKNSMREGATNLHFHGFTIPPLCHEDDVLETAIDPDDPPFEYDFRVPADQPPGLYWYHPHMHGLTKDQVLGGASGALIVEGIESFLPELAGLPEQIFIIRDQNLLNPNAAPAENPGSIPPVRLDRDGDAVNTGTGTGKPAKDLSINFVPVPYPDYRPATIQMRAGERQLWRVLNASAITYLNLQVVFDGVAQRLGVVGLDGAPLTENRLGGAGVVWLTHLGVPPGGRVEFLLNGPAQGTRAELLTRSVNTGPIGENDPARRIARIVALNDSSATVSRLPAHPAPLKRADRPWLGNVSPVRTRRLYFSENPKDPKNPSGATDFYITVDGQTPRVFDPSSAKPNIVAREGEVEDWIIENRSQEVHAFHIHQVHFLLLEWDGLPMNEPYLRDTINVPFWDGHSLKYPAVKIRVDFRDPHTVGTFVYHCHILEHEDGGMMGLIRVEPAPRANDGESPAK